MLKADPPRPLRSPKDPIFRFGFYRDFAFHLTGKRETRALHAHCARTGIGMEDFRITEGKAVVYFAIVDGMRREGVFFLDDGGPPVATLRKGVVTSKTKGLAAALTKLLRTLPASRALEWSGGSRRPSESSPKSSAPPFSAKVVHELDSLAKAKALPALDRAQLTAAVKELSGKRTLAALFEWLSETDQSVMKLCFSDKSKPRYDAWLLSALEDGVFFDHGKRRPNGLAMSQGDVHDMTKQKRTDAATSLTAGLKALSKPRTRRTRKKKKKTT